jgi:hypothetical protein
MNDIFLCSNVHVHGVDGVKKERVGDTGPRDHRAPLGKQ